MNLAIDSYPLGQHIHKTYDYTGLQILSLKNKSLARSAKEIIRKKNHIEIKVGAKEGKAFLKSLEGLAKTNPLVRKIAFRGISEAQASDDSLALKVDECFDERNLRIPNLAIAKKGLAKSVTLVQNPAQNHTLYDAGKIDFLCDTAVNLELVDDSYDDSWTGLIGSLDYSRSFRASQAFKRLSHVINEYNPSPKFNVLNPVPVKALGQGKSMAGEKLRIAYDDFYPNYEIVSDLAAFLAKRGIETELVKDDYYRPAALYDMKFVINRPMGDSLVYHWMWLFNFSCSAEPLVQKIILSNIKKRAPFSLEAVASLGLGRALFKIPSFGKRNHKINPLRGLLGDLYELDIR